MKTYIIGHIKPDLDSVVAAISIAEFIKTEGTANPTPAIIDILNPESKFILEKFNVVPPLLISSKDILPEDKVILVDHNEPDQRLVGLNADQVIGIYDHHKANLNFSLPIEICIKPVGSSNTLAWALFKQSNINIQRNLAILMLCAILSDTVGLKSATTTETDKKAVANLAILSGISDIDSLTLEIFKAKSNIDSLTDEQVITNDYKILDFGKKVFIGQTETVEQELLLKDRKNDLVKALQEVKSKMSVDYIILAITDILKVNTKLLVSGAEENKLVEKAFGGEVQDYVLDIGPKMSRKKEINPAIENALKS